MILAVISQLMTSNYKTEETFAFKTPTCMGAYADL